MTNSKDNILTTLSFECSYGDIVTQEEPKMKIKEPGVYLHFLRFGLFDKSVDHTEQQYIQYDTDISEEEKIAQRKDEQLLLQLEGLNIEKSIVKQDNTHVATPSQQAPNSNNGIDSANVAKTIVLDEVVVKGKRDKLEGLPELKNFYHAKTSLNEGYIYLINKNNLNEYFELYVHPDGVLQHINWDYSKNKGKGGKLLDVRVPDSSAKEVRAKRIDPPGKELWVAYSATQWSREYHSMMINDEDLRKKRMKLIKCEAIKKGEEGNKPTEEHEIAPVPYNQIYAVFPDKEDTRIGDMLQAWDDIHREEKQEDKNGDNDEYQDLFFVLDDPIGMAQDVANVLNIAHDKHRATVESMQTGESESEIFNRLQTKPGTMSDFISTEYGQQANALFTNALTLHKFIHQSNEEIKDKFEDHVDFDKINKILGFEYRAKQRETIAAIRKDYLEIIKSDYYKTAFVDGQRGSDQDTFENRSIIASQLSLLTEHPQHKDRFIDPNYDYKGNEDADFDDFIANSVNSEDEHFQLFTKEINLDEISPSNRLLNSGISLTVGAIKLLEDVSTAYTRHAYLVEDTEIIDKTVKAFKDSNGWNIKINTKQLEKALSKANKGLFPQLLEQEGVRFGNKGRILKIRTSKTLAQQAAKGKSIQLTTQGLGSNTSKLVKNIIDHPRFRKWMAGIELVNTVIKGKAASNRSLKEGVGFVGSLASLTAAVLAYKEACLKAASGSEKTIISLGKGGKVAGPVGGAISTAMIFSDMVDSLKVNDNDASVVLGLSGLVSAVLVVDSVFLTISWFNAVASGGLAAAAGTSGILSGGITIALTIALFAGVGLALYLTDSPLEKFIKNNILSKENLWNSNTAVPYRYVKELYSKREKLVDTEVARWRDFVVASDDLYDILISYKVEDTPSLSDIVDLEQKEDPSYGDKIKHLIRSTSGLLLQAAKTFTISVTLRKFYDDKSEFRYALAFFPEEIKTHPQQKPTFLLNTKTELDTSNGLYALKITYNLNSKILKSIKFGSEFIFFSNTLIHEEFHEYWPSQRGGTRYHAYKFDADYKTAGVAISPSTAGTSLGIMSSDLLSAYLGKNVRVGTEEELVLPETWK
ncbi:toxin VasX [Fulvivirga sediminis]|uniref:Toxin VasX N-terminal region domain-containing protein n=1 Tax=Fulvivirga sediminis TaxID=2803949 RepID=A0A937K278_9BACT|nr:toxin VasX [Fulvivirga sediminis]MBL3658286.1 hypothetical protein [Fulvivirga sediminis]